MLEPDAETTQALKAMFDPNAEGGLLTADRIAERRRMTKGERWVIAKFERRLERPLTREEEQFALQDARQLGMV